MKKYNPPYIDAGEKELMEGLEVMDARAVAKPTTGEKKEIRNAARRYLKAEAKMNISAGRLVEKEENG